MPDPLYFPEIGSLLLINVFFGRMVVKKPAPVYLFTGHIQLTLCHDNRAS